MLQEADLGLLTVLLFPTEAGNELDVCYIIKVGSDVVLNQQRKLVLAMHREYEHTAFRELLNFRHPH